MIPNAFHLNEGSEGAAQAAIETAIINYFQVRDCIVHFDTQRACILFNTREHRQWIARFNGHVPFHGEGEVPVTIPLAELPRTIRHSAQPVLKEILAQDALIESFRKWKALERTIVPGTISETTTTYYTISLKGGVGTLMQRDAIDTELYDLAISHLFHIKRVRLKGERVRIFLSRRSKTLPEYVLKTKFPKYRFHCYRRIPGAKAWIRTTAPRYRWRAFLSKEIRTPLAGEYLKFYTWHKGADHG